MQLTPEQEAVLDTNCDLVINAVAGSGKTTTLISYAKSRASNSKILYLAFNKTVKSEAIQKFSAAGVKNVKIETAHSLAYDHIIRNSRFKVVQGYKSYEWCDILGIKTGDRHADFILANHVNKFLSYFCNSSASKVQDLNYADTITDKAAKTFASNFYSHIEKFTRQALAKMHNAEIDVIHDFYLKKFQLGQPVLPYDYILFDEGQDASAAMLSVFLKQKAIKVIVGDTNQQIYSWRYAVNSLQQVDFPVYNLSNSFRFDDEVAFIANKVLSLKKHLNIPGSIKITGAGNNCGSIITNATLGRKNISLLLNSISQSQHGNLRKLYFEGNINSYTFADEGASLYDILDLYNGKKGKIRDRLIAEMNDMRELEEYIRKTDDTSLAMIVEVVKEFGNKLPSLINELKANHTTVKEEADMIFSTVHRCKGMEYDSVTLLNDFINEEKLKRNVAQCGGDKISEADKNRFAEEINILYVAATRAKNKLKIPAEINPLKSIELSLNQPLIIQPDQNYLRNNYLDLPRYPSLTIGREYKSNLSGRPGNHGKRWTEEEVSQLEKLFDTNHSIETIAKELGRGEKGVRIKLINMGLLRDEQAP